MGNALTSAATLRALDAATKKIRAYKRAIGENVYGLGVELMKVSDGKLYLARHETFEDYCNSDDVRVRHDQAYCYVRVARAFNEKAVREHGVDKLDAGIRYCKATKAHESYLEVLRARIPVGLYGETKSFAEATTAEIEEAATRLARRNGAARKRPDGFEDADAICQQVTRAIASLRNKPPVTVKTSFSRKRKKHVIDIRGIDVDAIDNILRTIVNGLGGPA
jgi:hypothetical protein